MRENSNNDRRAVARSHYEELGRIGKALASPARLFLVDLLRQGPRTVEALAQEAGLTTANTSQHLQLLRATRLVDADKQGQHVTYRLADGASRLFASLRGLAESLLPEMDRIGRELGVLSEDERAGTLARIRAGEVTLLDVRPDAEYRAGHLPGALGIPLEELERRLAELPRGRDVVAYCRGPYCPMALHAVELLARAGYRALHLDLGVPDLHQLRFRLEEGAPPPKAPRAKPMKPRPNARAALGAGRRRG